MTFDAEVLVAGAGPVGSVAAYILARAGIDVILLEAHPTWPRDLRASTLHPPTLEMLDEIGLTSALIPQGLKAPVYQYRNRSSGAVISFDLSELSDVTRYPFRLQCEQFKLARLVTERLAEEPGSEVRFSRRVTAFTQDSSGVTVHAETPIEMETYRARYLLACDGSNSIIRKWLGVQFDGFTYPEKFLTVSTKYPIEQHFEDLAYVNYVSDPDEWVVLLRVPDLWRVLVPAADSDPDEFLLSDGKKEQIFRHLVGDGAVETEHRTIYRVHQRVAQKYRSGRVILAGDAAHLNNPLGGLGMNSGIHDVWNLCDKLIQILREGASEERLDLYERQRRAVMMSFVQAQTIKNKADMEARDSTTQDRRQAEMEAIAANRDERRKFLLTQAMFMSLRQEAAIL